VNHEDPAAQQVQVNQQVQKDEQRILDAQSQGKAATLKTYVSLSGPGWLQSAITLGGGSLAGSLYLGVLGGFSMMWIQPVAMILGVIMLSGISYVTLSTGERPFDAINREVNPVLGWGWAIATLLANLVWALPQFSLGTAALRQNLMPSILGSEAMSEMQGKLIACCGILVICFVVVWFYDTGYKGIRLFEYLLKVLVGVIVICFVGVVIKMSYSGAGLPWGQIAGGFIPDFSMLSSPAESFAPFIANVAPEFQTFWSDRIVDQQRDVMITVTATAVGINMTFLLPYSMLKRGWNKNFRGLAIFDLSTGLFIPFVLATSCVVIASASQFHAAPSPGLLGERDAAGALVEAVPGMEGKFEKIALARVAAEFADPQVFANLSDEVKQERIAALAPADKTMAAMLVKRDAFNLADSLAPLTGPTVAQTVFGVGVLGMAFSTIIILMLINGFVVCEMLGLPSKGWPHRIGCMMPAIGALAPFIWTGGKAQFWLAVPTSVFGMTLIPIAYFTFLLVMNNRRLLGDNMPRGGKRFTWNLLMTIAILWTGFGSMWAVWSKAGWYGMTGVAAFILLAVVVHFARAGKAA
jgi:Mn2+/Fe2+ NRAMP family transporter